MDDAEFKKLEKSEADIEKQKQDIKDKLKEFYYTIKDFLKQYCDMRDEYYTIIPLWVLGTYFHSHVSHLLLSYRQNSAVPLILLSLSFQHPQIHLYLMFLEF